MMISVIHIHFIFRPTSEVQIGTQSHSVFVEHPLNDEFYDASVDKLVTKHENQNLNETVTEEPLFKRMIQCLFSFS